MSGAVLSVTIDVHAAILTQKQTLLTHVVRASSIKMVNL